MKIALLLSGQLSTFIYSKHYVAFKNFISNNKNVDVFCVTEDNNYYDSDSKCQIFSLLNTMPVNEDFRICNNQLHLSYEENKIKILNILNETFKDSLKSIKIYNCADIHNEKTLIKNKYHKFFMKHKLCKRSYDNKLNQLNQFYKLFKCFKLMELYEHANNIRYDIVIRCRFDCSFYINDINNLNYNHNIYLPFCSTNRHINDWIAFGDRHIMEIYSKYYSYFAPCLLENYFHFLQNNNGIWSYHSSGYNLENNNLHDISDSSEVGLTYTILKQNYNINPFYNFNLNRSYK